ncbi:MAG: hypothetical protein ABSE04_03470 [Candidatus Microgenomates bacterium]|jgi:hypothetical protein
MVQPLPNQAKQYFWGDNLNELEWPKYKKYIIQTLLDKSDIASVHWLFTKVSKREIQALLPSLKLQSKSSNFWKVYLS